MPMCQLGHRRHPGRPHSPCEGVARSSILPPAVVHAPTSSGLTLMGSGWAYLWVFEIAAVQIACMEGILHLAHAARTEVCVSASGCEGGACPIQFDDSLQESPCGWTNMSATQPMQHR